jgi:YesN/AraC family two-component response regulator
MARILIIDDEEQIRIMLRKTLEKAGYGVVDAPNGKIAKRLFQAEPADLIITDIVMPEKDGLETIMEFRKDFPGVKIIAISGGGLYGHEENYLNIAKKLGVLRIFPKPFNWDEMIESVRELVDE